MGTNEVSLSNTSLKPICEPPQLVSAFCHAGRLPSLLRVDIRTALRR